MAQCSDFCTNAAHFPHQNHVLLVLVVTPRLFARFQRLLDRFAPFFLQGIDINTPFAV